MNASRIPIQVDPRDVDRYRRRRLRPFSLRTEEQCRRFVDSLGFCYAFSGGPGGVPGVFDVIGTRSVDRMWSWAWTWKDHLATRRRVFYGRVLRRKPTFISLRYLPCFYALSGNTGDPEDYLAAYEAGHLSLLARQIYETVERHAPLTTWDLRRRFVSERAHGGRFHRALEELQERLLIAKVAEVEGRGNYAYIWDTFRRWLPEVVDRAGRLSSEDAAASVLRGYLRIVGVASAAEVEELFRWPGSIVHTAADRAGARTVRVSDQEAWTLPGLVV